MIITVDTGGTKTLVASFNQFGEPTNQIKFPTPQDPNEYIEVLKKTLIENFSDQPVKCISMAVPGTINSDNSIIWCPNLVDWKGFNPVAALTGILNNAPILFENDANLAGLYEAKIIDPIPAQCLYVTISTGIGTGIISNGHIDKGLRNSEGGRALVEYDGILQEWQNFSSGKSFYNDFGKFVRDITDEETWDKIIERMIIGFEKLIPTLQPDIVVIGGSVGTYFDRFGAKLQSELAKRLPKHMPCPTFIPAVNSEEAVIYGCYYYAIDSISA